MAQLSYSFCMSMLHSLWQAGLLALVYFAAEKFFRAGLFPLQKRNLLFILLGAQFLFSITTFFLYFFKIENVIDERFVITKITTVLSADILSAITPWLFGMYLVAISYKMIRSVYEWQHFKKRFYTGLQKPAIDLKLFTISKAHHFGIKSKVTLWLSNTIHTPMTFGFFKPVIVLPVALINNLTVQQAETLILHELSHIRANDYLLNWVLIIAENIFFFNPFIISICKKIRLEREKYCDSNVIAFNYSPLLYAETLLQAQQVRQYIPQYQLAAVTGKAQLLQRVQYFTDSTNFSNKRNKIVTPVLGVIITVLFATAVLFQYQLNAVAKRVTVVETVPVYPAPLSNEAGTMPAFVNAIIENLTDDNLEKIQAAVAKQQPVIEKQLKKLDPLIKSVTGKAEEMARQFDNNTLNNGIIPVVLKEEVPTRKIIVKEEQSGSKDAVIKVYTVSLINGKWVIVPDWMLAAKEIPDSLQYRIADSTNNIISQQ